MRKWKIASLTILFLIGCARVTTKPTVVSPVPAPTPSATPPVLEKTFGEVWYGGVAMLHISYKDINIMVDPLFADAGSAFSNYPKKLKGSTLQGIVVKKDALPPVNKLPPADYLLLTDLQPHHFGNPLEPVIRKNMKVLAPPDAALELSHQGFSSVKVLNPGQRLLLKKNNAFLFISAVQSENSVTHMKVNGYLLEFDNGRNIFISGETYDADLLRPFLYNLRDDGKEIHLAFFYGGGMRTDETETMQSADENTLAEMATLFQPKIACVVETHSLSVMQFDEKKFRDALKEQIFFGEVLIPRPGDTISF